MDVVLLSRMIGELMPGLDSLSLPGLGTFTAEQMSASFSDKGYTINPPYRRLGFTSKATEDGLLTGLYASSNGVSAEEADAILRAYTASLSEDLRSSGSVELPGLGRLRSTREGHLFFVPDEDLDISPEACGLTSVSLKSHSVSLPDLNIDSSAPLRSGQNDRGKDRSGQNDKGEEHSDQNDRKTAVKSRPRRVSRTFLWIAIPILAIVLIIGGFAALSRVAPTFTDKLLYTPEQLAIINAPENGTDIPR